VRECDVALGECGGLERVGLEELRGRLRSMVSGIDAVLARREALRDELIKMGRDIVRLSGWSINAIHLSRLDEAAKHIDSMDSVARSFIEKARSDPLIWHSGFVNNVLSEYVEAKVFYELVAGGRLPGPDDLGVEIIPYLQGLGDVIGELRRLALDYLRLGRLGCAERLLGIMEVLYYELRVLEYPDALMPGVRHKIDVARRLIDDTKSLLLSIKARLPG